MFTVKIKFGSVEPQIRYLPIPGGLKAQSRRVERDRAGVVTLVTEWKDLGSTITFDPEKKRPWWKKILT